jgi:SAM-dependent methyltransferase
VEPTLEETKQKFTNDGVWELDIEIEQMLKRQIMSLPPSDNLSKQEYRYPEDKTSLRGFLDKFFARHFFQVQNAILQPDCFERILATIRNGNVTIADIGCGPAVASLALIKLFSYISDYMHRPVNFTIVLNDTVPEMLAVGCKMLNTYKNRLAGINISRIINIGTPFPESMVQLRRISSMLNQYDICCLSYVLLPLKEEATYMQMRQSLKNLFGYLKPTGVGLITQDKFRESLARRVGSLLNSSTQKMSLRQKVYDSKNSCDELLYEYFRILVLPEITQGVSNKFCLQKYAFIR